MRTQLAMVAAALILGLCMNGCAPIDSIYPLYNVNDAEFDVRLLGTWQPISENGSDSDKDQRWIFEQSKDDKFYDARWTSLGAKGGFVARARLVRLGTGLFIDLEGDDHLDDQANSDFTVPFPFITTHFIGRIWIEQDTLRIRFLSDDWIKKQTKANTLSLAHLETSQEQILTVSTEDLRKFMQAHADDYDALAEKFEFQRVK